MNIYLKKYGLKRIAWAFTSYERAIDTDYWCDYYSKECNMLKAMKDEPIHLNCSPLESYEHSEFYSIIFLFIFLSVTFYLPFISVCTIKAIFKIFKWIISGFIESNPSQKNATNKHKRER